MPAYFMTQPRRSAPARRNPVLQVGHAVDDVWAAAVLADRINSGYVKDTEYRLDPDTGRQSVVRETNRFIVQDTLQNRPQEITDELRAEGRVLREQIAQDLMLRTLKGTISSFDNGVREALAVTDRMYTVSHRHELAVIPCLPAALRRSQRQAEVDHLLRGCGPISAQPGTRVDLAVRVVKCIYSRHYNVYFVTAVTDDQGAVVFANREQWEFGTNLTIRGNVRDHDSYLTRLNRVKVL